jgi:hypothetical protein
MAPFIFAIVSGSPHLSVFKSLEGGPQENYEGVFMNIPVMGYFNHPDTNVVAIVRVKPKNL